MSYSLPRKIFIAFEEEFGKDKAELIASEFESSITTQVVDTNKNLEISVKEKLRFELATKEDIEHLRQETRKDIHYLNTQLKWLMGLVVLFGTVLNPNLLDFIIRVIGK